MPTFDLGYWYTKSPGMSIMRVESQELQLSAIPLCQLFPCHLGSPRPTLSINLYVKGCMSKLSWLHHWSIPHVHTSSLLSFRFEVQIINAKPCKLLTGLCGDNVLRLDIADLSDHCPVIPLQIQEVWLCQWSSLTSMEHCTPHTRAIHTAMRLEYLFFLFFPENKIWHFMQIVSLGDNLHEMSNPVFWEK